MHVKLIRPVAPRLLVPRSVISQKFLSVIYNFNFTTGKPNTNGSSLFPNCHFPSILQGT